MALFRKNKQNDVLPEEVQDYYRAEQRDRMGMAWLLAVGAFIATILVVFGLFFAGRWVYRSLTSNGVEETETSEQIQTDSEENESITSDETTDDAPNVPGVDSGDDGDDPVSSEDATDLESNQSDDSDAGTSGSNGEEEALIPASGGDSENELPRTGPQAE